jgi:hypothetical protein
MLAAFMMSTRRSTTPNVALPEQDPTR